MKLSSSASDEATGWAVAAARAASAKTDSSTIVLSVGDLLAITDLFVVTSAGNSRQVRALTEEIERSLAEQGGPKPNRVEGLDDLRWVLMDYGAFVVHVFLEETRAFYDLERLWSDAAKVDWEAESADSQ